MVDVKISALGAITTVAGEDLVAIIDDPSGTPVSKKATIDQIKTYVGGITASSTDTFTNKTFDADGTGNSITNIENADIKASAGIVITKLASGTANYIVKTNSGGTALEHGLITNANIDASAGIALSKLATDPLARANHTGTQAFSTITGTVPINQGGSGATTAQDAINALTQVSGATNEYVLTKDTSTGNATWKVASTVASFDDLTDVSVGSQAQGDVLYFNGTNWVSLPAGTSGYFLKTQGTGANPIWASAGGGDEVNPVLQANGYTPTYTSPSTEGSDKVSIWVETIDSNNQGVYAKIKKNGSYVTVQIA
jgi:hypothetical protein